MELSISNELFDMMINQTSMHMKDLELLIAFQVSKMIDNTKVKEYLELQAS